MKEELLMAEKGGAWEIPYELWDYSIVHFQCSNRTINALMRSRYFTLGQLNGVEPTQISKLRNIGQHGLEEIHAEIQRILTIGKASISKDIEAPVPKSHISVSQFKDAIKLRQDKETRMLLEKRIPNLPKTILVPDRWSRVAIDRCHLDIRTTNALQRNHFKNLSDLNSFPPHALLRMRGLGVQSVVRFMRQLDTLFAGPGPDVWQLNQQDSPETINIPESIEKALALVRRRKPESDDRLIYVISARFGLLGHERMTLQQIGDSLHLSRERVRQLEKIGLRRLIAARGTTDWGQISTAPEWSLMLRAIDRIRVR